MIRYLNTRTNYGVETVETLDRKDFESGRAFKAELKRPINECAKGGGYASVCIAKMCKVNYKF